MFHGSPILCEARSASIRRDRKPTDASPSTSIVTLDLGLDIHLPLSNADARDYAAKRVEVLKKKRAVLVGREERIQWEIEQFEGAVKEAMARESGQPQQQTA